MGAVRLTPREQDVLRLLATGLKSTEVATALFVTQNTAREYIARLYEKFDARGRSALIARALALGVIELRFHFEEPLAEEVEEPLYSSLGDTIPSHD